MKTENIVNNLIKQYKKFNPLAESEQKEIPDNKKIIEIIDDLKAVFFPEFFGGKNLWLEGLKDFTNFRIKKIYNNLKQEIEIALKNFSNDNKLNAEELAQKFIDDIPNIHKVLFSDRDAFFENDPAAENKSQIILSYPGFFAIMVYRIAHSLHKLSVPMLPRMMTEYAHNITGVDIHPGAEIGDKFFIDHGTGVVIGETTIIGKNVRIYQSVTLGGLSIKNREACFNKKRHPTIKDNVVIYANATILGGETVVGENSIIGGGTFVTESIPANTLVSVDLQKNKFKTRSRN